MDYGHPMKAEIKEICKIWADVTKYALAVPLHLGVECIFGGSVKVVSSLGVRSLWPRLNPILNGHGPFYLLVIFGLDFVS